MRHFNVDVDVPEKLQLDEINMTFLAYIKIYGGVFNSDDVALRIRSCQFSVTFLFLIIKK
jgi:hypothetical protein